MVTKIRIKKEDGLINVSARIGHPMETGRRLLPGSKEVIPAFHITEIYCSLNGEVVMSAFTGTGISTNPFFSFYLADAKAGDLLELSWSDNQGNKQSTKTII